MSPDQQLSTASSSIPVAAGVGDGTADGSPGRGEVTWRDPKRYAWLMGAMVPLLPFAAWGLVKLTGAGVFWFAGPALVFVVFPILDVVVGMDPSNPPDSVLKWLEQDRYYRYCTYLFLPLLYVSLVFACWMWAYGDLTVFDKIGLAVTLAMVSGIAIADAHELGHKRDNLERWLSKIALAPTGYGHFYIEHNRGHHVRVSTPEDPASARMGESFYAFWPRTVLGSLRSAWRLEKARFGRLERSLWTLSNDLFNAWLMTIVLYGALIGIFGVTIVPYLLLQAVLGFSLLEVVNYLEHYGLLRQRREDGRYERCRASHSWNSNNVASNVLLYHLQRHSDHHAYPVRRYQALRHLDEAPQLPTGYAGMMVLALIPPLWNRVMDRRLIDHYDGDVTRANIHPRRRERILARCGVDESAGAR
jgi:alkane 1-monooxygenase